MTEELFKSTLVGGYDKEDVITQVERMKADAWEEQERLRTELTARDEKITQLNKRLELKDEQYARLETEIREKYQKYADNFEIIGKLAVEAQIRAEETVAQAQTQAEEIVQKAREEAEQIRAQAQTEARKRIDSVQGEVDEKLAEGKKYYTAVQDEMNEIVELINQAQSRFMESYKEVHRIVNSMPGSLREMEDETGEIGADQKLVAHVESLFGDDEEEGI